MDNAANLWIILLHIWVAAACIVDKTVWLIRVNVVITGIVNALILFARLYGS